MLNPHASQRRALFLPGISLPRSFLSCLPTKPGSGSTFRGPVPRICANALPPYAKVDGVRVRCADGGLRGGRISRPRDHAEGPDRPRRGRRRRARCGPAPSAADGGEVADAGDSAEDPALADPQLTGGSDAGARLITGEAAPPLAGDAPKSIVFGVILVTYKGAQGAPPNARSRDAALELAKQLAADAKQDFKATVAKGDKGSMENAGRMPRGMLEPAPEFVLFSLPKDGVSDPVDTPRGYWIVRRIE